MSARPTDVVYAVELIDHADMEHEAPTPTEQDTAMRRAGRMIALGRAIKISRAEMRQAKEALTRAETIYYMKADALEELEDEFRKLSEEIIHD